MSLSKTQRNVLRIASAMLLSTGSVAFADVIYVDADATGADNGTTWDDAFNDLQDGLAAAVAGDGIWVAEGAYGVSGLQLVDNVALYGGFAGWETNRDERDWVANETILSGSGLIVS